MKTRGAFRKVAATIPLILATAAQAQAPSAEPESSMEQVTVTGSRIQRQDGFSSPTPVTVLGADRLDQRAATNLGDALNELPSFRASTNPATLQTTGGSSVIIAAAMITFHSGSCEPPRGTSASMPTTAVRISAVVVIMSGHRYSFQP